MGGGLPVILPGAGPAPVQMPDHRGACGAEHPVPIRRRGVEVADAVISLFPVLAVGGPGIPSGGVQLPGQPDQLCHPAVSLLAGAEFVAQREHDKGGVVGVAEEDLPQFRLIIYGAVRGFQRVGAVPVGQFGLEQHSQFISRRKGRLGRAPGMEPQTVDPVGPVATQNLPPGPGRHGRVASLGKDAAVGLPAQQKHPAVEGEPSPVRPEGPQAEVRPGAGHRPAVQHERRRDLRQGAAGFLPQRGLGGNRQIPAPEGAKPLPQRFRLPVPPEQAERPGQGGAFQHQFAVADRVQRLPGHRQIHRRIQRPAVGIDPHRPHPEVRNAVHAQPTQKAVPVGLGLVGRRRGMDNLLPLGQLPVERFQLGGQVPALFRLLLAEKIIHRRVQRPGDADKHPGIGHRQSCFPPCHSLPCYPQLLCQHFLGHAFFFPGRCNFLSQCHGAIPLSLGPA